MCDINSYVNGYLSDKERFADLMNGVIFHGKKVVEAKDLSDLDTKIWKAHAATGGASEENIRDHLKCWNYKGKTFILGVEAEQNIQYAMPVRMLNYDASQYSKHYKYIKKGHRRNRDLPSREYVSGFAKTEKLYPVLSMVLYLGKDIWDAAHRLSEICGMDEVDEEIRKDMEPFFNDWNVRVVDINTLENTDMFATDLREVLGFLKNQKEKEKLQEFVKENDGFRHLKPDAYAVIMRLSNTKQLDIAKETYETEGEIDMCQAIDEMIADAKEEGMREGKLEGMREGKLEGKREGKREGIREGIREGKREEQIRGEQERRLFACLVREQRYKDLERATQEEGIRLKLMEEYGLFPYDFNIPVGG